MLLLINLRETHFPLFVKMGFSNCGVAATSRVTLDVLEGLGERHLASCTFTVFQSFGQ